MLHQPTTTTTQNQNQMASTDESTPLVCDQHILCITGSGTQRMFFYNSVYFPMTIAEDDYDEVNAQRKAKDTIVRGLKEGKGMAAQIECAKNELHKATEEILSWDKQTPPRININRALNVLTALHFNGAKSSPDDFFQWFMDRIEVLKITKGFPTEGKNGIYTLTISS